MGPDENGDVAQTFVDDGRDLRGILGEAFAPGAREVAYDVEEGWVDSGMRVHRLDEDCIDRDQHR